MIADNYDITPRWPCEADNSWADAIFSARSPRWDWRQARSIGPM